MRRDISELKQAVESTNAALRQAVEGLNATNAAVVSTNAKLDSTNARLDSTNAELNSTNSRLNRTMISVARLAGDMTDMKQYLAENMATKKDMSDLNSRMDGFSGLLLDSRHRWAVHAETLSEHDARLKKLETPTA
jgi:chromosome segregation ATPase